MTGSGILRLSAVAFILVMTASDVARAADAGTVGGARERADRRRHRRRTDRERPRRHRRRSHHPCRARGSGPGAAWRGTHRSCRSYRDPRADRSALPHRERSQAGAAPIEPRRHRVPRSGAVERQVRRTAADDRGRRSARAPHLHDRATHRRRAPRLSRRLRRRPGSCGSAPAGRDLAGAGRVGAQDLLPSSLREREGGYRRVPVTEDPLHGASRASGCWRVDSGRPARHRAHHVVRCQRAAPARRRSLSPGRTERQRREARRALPDLCRGESRWPGGTRALRRSARAETVGRSHARGVRASSRSPSRRRQARMSFR